MNKNHKPTITSRASLRVAIRAIGSPKGLVIPKIILEQSGIEESVKMSVDGEKMIMSKSKNTVRESWAKEAQSIAMEGEDGLDQIRPVDKARLVKK